MRHCVVDAASVSYSGKTYGRFTLSGNSNLKRQLATPSTLLSSFDESISLWFRTETPGGVLLLLGNLSDSFAMIKVFYYCMYTYILLNYYLCATTPYSFHLLVMFIIPSSLVPICCFQGLYLWYQQMASGILCL